MLVLCLESGRSRASWDLVRHCGCLLRHCGCLFYNLFQFSKTLARFEMQFALKYFSAGSKRKYLARHGRTVAPWYHSLFSPQQSMTALASTRCTLGCCFLSASTPPWHKLYLKQRQLSTSACCWRRWWRAVLPHSDPTYLPQAKERKVGMCLPHVMSPGYEVPGEA